MTKGKKRIGEQYVKAVMDAVYMHYSTNHIEQYAHRYSRNALIGISIPPYCLIRQVLFTMLREYTTMTNAAVAWIFRQDHATVNNSTMRVYNREDTEPAFLEEMKGLREAIAMRFAKLDELEESIRIDGESVSGNADLIRFAAYLTGHDPKTVAQMYADWRRFSGMN